MVGSRAISTSLVRDKIAELRAETRDLLASLWRKNEAKSLLMTYA